MALRSFWNYKWFDTPNDQDGLKKAVYLGKHATKIGLALGATDVIISDIQRSNLQKALRVGAWVMPLVGMSTAFTVTQQVSLKVFPNLDQKFAFMFGGASAGGVMGSWFKNGQMAFTASLIFGGVAFAYQYCREGRLEGKDSKWGEQFTFIPDHHEYISYERHQTSHWLFNNYDYRTMQNKTRGKQVENIG